MRNALSRIGGVAAGAALMALLLPAGSASAATSASCNPATSTVIFAPATILGYPNNYVYMEQQGANRVICFHIPFMAIGGGAVVIGPASGGSPVVVDQDTVPSACPESQDIFAQGGFRLSVNTNPATPTVCIALPNLPAKKIGLDRSQAPGTPTLEVWHDGTFSEIDVIACPLEYLAWLSDGPDTCMTTPGRIL